VLALGLVAVSCSAPQNTPAAPAAPAPTSAKPASTSGPRVILPDGAVIQVELATDDATRMQGLMYRDRLAEDRGMLFFFLKSDNYPFWMKNTLIPLDMVWIDDQRRIAHVSSNVPPCKADPCPSYDPKATAKYVLELAAGVAAKHHLADGQTVRFEAMDNVVVR
jgi:uncharacterized membrane protein (UPF0127 family)